MAKRLAVKVGEYESNGETKGEYLNIGVILEGREGGEFVLLDPSINLAGALMKQNILNRKNGKDIKDSLMVSVFDGDRGGKPQGKSGGKSGGNREFQDVDF
jgi:hypothetical protein